MPCSPIFDFGSFYFSNVLFTSFQFVISSLMIVQPPIPCPLRFHCQSKTHPRLNFWRLNASNLWFIKFVLGSFFPHRSSRDFTLLPYLDITCHAVTSLFGHHLTCRYFLNWASRAASTRPIFIQRSYPSIIDNPMYLFIWLFIFSKKFQLIPMTCLQLPLSHSTSISFVSSQPKINEHLSTSTRYRKHKTVAVTRVTRLSWDAGWRWHNRVSWRKCSSRH